MLLSELMQSPTSEALCFGVEVDTDMLSPPVGLEQIGLLYKGSPTEPDDDFVDAVIACSLAGVDTIAEIEPGQAANAETMLTIAGNAGFSIALIPPQTEDGIEAWCDRCADFAQAFLDTPHFSGQLYPVSGYFGHLVARSVADVDSHKPRDPYTRQRFADAIPTEWSDAAKAAMKQAWENRTGGTEAFDALLKTIAGTAVLETLDLIDRVYAEQSPPPNPS